MRLHRVTKAQMDRILNFLLWLSLCLMAATGCLLAYRLPPGSRGGGGLTAWGWSRHDWGDLHLWNSYVFLVLVILHLALHWRWMWHVAGGRFRILFLAGLIGGALVVPSAWLIPVKRDAKGGHGRGAEQGGRKVHGVVFEDNAASRGGGGRP